MSTTKKQLRRKGALARLEVQLKSGVKTAKRKLVDIKTSLPDSNASTTLPLSEKDINRINQEIKILQTKIKK